jgi:putative DNA primase/helicase
MTVSGDEPHRAIPHSSQIDAIYNYRDAGGNVLYQVVRFTGKRFQQRRPNGTGSWVWNLKGVQPVLYRLPELLAAPSDKPVFIGEGEKDADRLTALGLAATTPMGAGKWRSEYSETLRGRSVVILPDNDQPGIRHAIRVARLLVGIATGIKIVTLPNLPVKGMSVIGSMPEAASKS